MTDRMCLNPLHCGAVVASPMRRRATSCAKRSQSPSLRGSGRFACPRPVSGPLRLVSIPFIAGQWSLLTWEEGPRAGEGRVSIPFIAGQWSLRRCTPRSADRRMRSQSPSLRGSGRFVQHASARTLPSHESQSPSLRGSGRFARTAGHGPRAGPAGLNPLHCGAVVASWCPPAQRDSARNVSIPFIAGQWSLLICRRFDLSSWKRESQSPSLRGSGRFYSSIERR